MPSPRKKPVSARKSAGCGRPVKAVVCVFWCVVFGGKGMGVIDGSVVGVCVSYLYILLPPFFFSTYTHTQDKRQINKPCGSKCARYTPNDPVNPPTNREPKSKVSPMRRSFSTACHPLASKRRTPRLAAVA